MIGLTTVNYYCTSDPRADILLLVRDGDSWRIARNVGTNPDLSELAHGTAEFIGEGIDDVSVAGSSWRRTDDPKSQVFFESNAGPHRWYEQKWRREGTQYVLKSERVLPSAYATLVDFVYALSNGDDSAAASLTTDSSLVATAKQVGLVRRVGERPWFGHCRGEFVYDLEKEPPCTVTLPNDTHVVVSMVRDGENWLVSGIELQPAS